MRWLVIIVALAACKKDPCDQAVDHAFGMKDFASVLAFEAGDLPAAKSSAKQGCKMQPWSDAAKQCLANASTKADLVRCMEMTELVVWHHAQLDARDPNGTRRYAELDAAVAPVREAVAYVTPGDDSIPCDKATKPAVAFDLDAARLIVAAKVPPEHAMFVVPESNGLARYAANGKVYSDEVDRLRAWAAKLPKDAAWAFIETKQRVEPQAHGEDDFDMGTYEAVMHVVDPAQKAEVCRTHFTAQSSDEVKTLAGSDEKVNGQMNEAMIKRDFIKRIDDAVKHQIAGLPGAK